MADIVDIWDSTWSQAAGCDAVLAMDCADLVPEPYFIYLCPEQGGVLPADLSVYERALGLFAENGRTAQRLVEDTGIPREKIHVVLPAACQARTYRYPPHLREAPRRKLLLCISDRVSQSAASEPVRLMCEVLGILRRQYDQRIEVTVAGLREWPDAGSPPDGINFRSEPPTAGSMALVDYHDLLVILPGLDFCGLPEALSLGVPCVASRADEMHEAFLPGVTGTVLNDGNAGEIAAAIAAVLANDDVYHRCFERAPAMAVYFSWERVARQVTHVISREMGLMP